ncbi:EF-hand domain-containing protein [Streptomyces sp. NPDC048623]|uniref:EF-hand domain-containing protein n=1 Tax=Streptomyces sp. NPDC048623 TaxID=3155761 RepID=UPI00342C657A
MTLSAEQMRVTAAKVFDEADTDKDGTVSVEEFLIYLQGKGVDMHTAQNLFLQMNFQRDTLLTRTEFDLAATRYADTGQPGEASVLFGER